MLDKKGAEAHHAGHKSEFNCVPVLQITKIDFHPVWTSIQLLQDEQASAHPKTNAIRLQSRYQHHTLHMGHTASLYCTEGV